MITTDDQTERLDAPGHTLLTTLNRPSSRIDWVIRLVTFLLPAAFLLVVIYQPWVEAKWMFLDPLTAAELAGDCCHVYYGFVSTLGVMLWTISTSICLFAAVLLAATNRYGPTFRFALTAGL